MTEKDELVEAIREAVWRPACNFQGNIVGGSCPLNEDEIKAAIASIRPTIERETEERLADWIDRRALLTSSDKAAATLIQLALDIRHIAKSHGLDLTQDGER